jgi:hypothetical protein
MPSTSQSSEAVTKVSKAETISIEPVTFEGYTFDPPSKYVNTADLIKDVVLESSNRDTRLIDYIAEKFKVSKDVSKQVVEQSAQYARKTFPSQMDILAIIAIESKFNPKAESHGNFGLMQIQSKSHRDKSKGRSLFNISANIQIGAEILNEYYVLMGNNIRAATSSYNVGPGTFLKRKVVSTYYDKYRARLQEFSKIQ